MGVGGMKAFLVRLFRRLGFVPCRHEDCTIDSFGTATCNDCGRPLRYSNEARRWIR